ncbi:MAG: tRNA pseudouridine(38-40) synthase TruA [Gammaproteobacteria bacterium]|nr:MAG: tRNA pseudouridine(38-40) synthase TruA [Gammaproteobacteria bacterium]
MRYALGLEYDGAGFIGWQRQRNPASVQQCVEKALAAVADHPVTVICAGRTDTGVHARGQVVHFDSTSQRSARQWMLGINSNLPAAVRTVWIREVDDSFHARFGAYSRSYRYSILNRWVRPAIGAAYYGWCREALDEQRMHAAAQALVGKHDFSAFRSAGCSAQFATREVTAICVQRQQDLVTIDITANAFLYHMVRNIAGSLIAVGRGDESVRWCQEVLQSRDRKLAGVTAEAQGLCFMRVRYDPKYELPEQTEAFPFAITVDEG